MTKSANGPIAAWLLICCLLVFSMILLGGATRLTQSGLSMVDWDPIMGVIPPLGEGEWMDAFRRYQAYPEFQIVNKDMTLAGFKRIFYMEYAHRMLGRAIGLAFFLPFLFFLFTGSLSRRLVFKLSVLFVLGGLQGVMGWYMVQSGLVDKPHVSPYRLTAHLMFALLILGYMLWQVFDLSRRDGGPISPATPARLRFGAAAVLIAIIFMIFTGGFVAGTKAGFTFNTFPKMHGSWVPESLWALQPWWRNFFENVATVQFVHRCTALAVTALIIGFWLMHLRSGVDSARLAAGLMVLMLVVQVGLGIATVLSAVPTALGVAHQGGALLLFSLALLINHQLKYGFPNSPNGGDRQTD